MKDKPSETESGGIVCSACERYIGVTEKVDQTHVAEAYATYKAAELPKGRGRKGRKPQKAPRNRGDDFNGYQPKGQGSAWLDLSDKYHPKTPLAHSAKSREILKIIEGWQEDAPDDKIIVFTQWILMARIVGRHLEDSGIDFLYFISGLTPMQRERNLQSFQGNGKIKVIIMGFKCGGQSLDMHYANRVILSDPWWNVSGENQAFGRVLRKVQEKKTFLVRLIANDTIDNVC